MIILGVTLCLFGFFHFSLLSSASSMPLNPANFTRPGKRSPMHKWEEMLLSGYTNHCS